MFTSPEWIAISILALTALIAGRLGLRHHSFLLQGDDKRLSTSKTTAYVWTLFTVAVLASLLVQAAVKGGAELQVYVKTLNDLPSNTYLLFLGGPFAALVGAKGIVTARLANGSLQKSTNEAEITVDQLYKDDAGNGDLIDIQFLLFNALALLWALVSFLKDPSAGLPDVPDGIAGLTSVAALAYLGNKAVGNNTLGINRISPVDARPGETITLYGANFFAPGGDWRSDITVTIGGSNAEVVDASDTRSVLHVVVPASIGPAQGVLVAVTNSTQPGTAATATMNMNIIPDGLAIRDVTPRPVRTGEDMKVFGAFLMPPDMNVDVVEVRFVDVEVPIKTVIDRESIVVTVPSGALPDGSHDQDVVLTVRRDQFAANRTIKVVSP